jgi:thioredoxin 1
MRMAVNNVLTFTASGFDADVLKSNEPVLVDFWYEDCPPCQGLVPIIEAVASEFAGKVKVGKLSVSDNSQVAARYNIRGVPTLLLFRGGEVVDQRVGSVGKSEVRKMLDPYV